VEEVDGIPFLTLELVEGQTLAQIIQVGALPLDRLLSIAIPLADAVGAAHQRRIAHRDLKPANVMVGRFGQVYVVDWGLARIRGRADSKAQALREAVELASKELVTDRRARAAEGHADSLLTADGVVIGTADLVALECVRCGNCESGRGCARGIASTDAELREMISEEYAEQRLVNMYMAWRKQWCDLLQQFGMQSVHELVGRSDLLVHLDYLDEEERSKYQPAPQAELII